MPNPKSQIPNQDHADKSVRTTQSLHKLRSFTLRPRVVRDKEMDTIHHRRMVVKQKDPYPVWCRIFEYRLPEFLKATRHRLAGISNNSVINLQAVYVRLVLQLSSERVSCRIRHKSKDCE